MGFWYFLLLGVGIFFVIKGVFKKKVAVVIPGVACIALSVFMFSPGSDELISKLFNL